MRVLQSMPVDLVVVCAGESEGDVYYDTTKISRDLNAWDFGKLHSSKWRLTAEGCRQVALSAAWILEKVRARFPLALISEEVMVKETAVLLSLPDARWQPDMRLRAREWGELEGHRGADRRDQLEQYARHLFPNAFFFRPSDGESNANVALRLTSLFQDMREVNAREAIIVCRSKVAWVIRLLLENMPTETYAKIRQDREGDGQLRPGTILHYTRHAEQRVAIKDAYCRRRIVCPWMKENLNGDWETMPSPLRTNEELLAEVVAVPPFFNC